MGVEFFCLNLGVARHLTKTFGGSARRLRAGWQAGLFESPETKPLRIGDRLVIVNVGEAVVPRQPPHQGGVHILVIPAGAAFGTGAHATTAMSLRLLERISRRLPAGWRMLDAGSGSGILALAGRRFGAREVIAVDNDRIAVRVARENARRNRISGVKFIVGDIGQHTSGPFDVITANLYSELLESMLPRFGKCLRKDGRVILSGVLRFQELQLRRAISSQDLGVLEARRRGKWVALLCSRR